MNKSKSKLLFLAVLMFLPLLTSCKPAKVKESNILEDLNATNIINLTIDNNDYQVPVTKVEIDQRQSDDKTDLIYATVYQQSSDFEMISSLRIFYSLYDKGGWQIDSFEVDSGPSVAIKHGINTNESLVYMIANYPSYTFLETSFDKANQRDTHSYSFSGSSNTAQYSGKVDLVFNFMYGWEFEGAHEHDLSLTFSPLGTWEFRSICGTFYCSPMRIMISKIDTVKNQVVYQYSTGKYDAWTSEYTAQDFSAKNLILKYSIVDNVIVFETLTWNDTSVWGGKDMKLNLFIDKINFYYYKNVGGNLQTPATFIK